MKAIDFFIGFGIVLALVFVVLTIRLTSSPQSQPPIASVTQNDVKLRKSDGSNVTVEIAKLIPFDQEYIKRTYAYYIADREAWFTEQQRLRNDLAKHEAMIDQEKELRREAEHRDGQIHAVW
jgi:hypothetical protein